MRLDIHRVSKTFRGKVRALDDVSVTAPGGILGMLGANGAGKTHPRGRLRGAGATAQPRRCRAGRLTLRQLETGDTLPISRAWAPSRR
jgi:ABC-type branched-subunit amino acid transport system ATPase component